MALAESQVRRQALLQGLGTAFCCWVGLVLLVIFHVNEVVDLKLLDARFRLRGERPTSDSIAIVGVDDATIRAYRAWPLPRNAYALLVTAIEAGGPRAIAFDLQFPEGANQDPRFDALLAYVADSHDNVVHSIGFDAEPSGPRSNNDDPSDTVRRHGVAAVGVPAPQAEEIRLPFADLRSSAHAFGHINVAVDRDGGIRRVPFFIRYGGRVYPALSLRALCVAEGASAPPEVRWRDGRAEARWGKDRSLTLPMNREGASLLDYSGDRGAFADVQSMVQVLQWFRDGDRARLANAFERRIVLVGLTATHEVTSDMSATPFSEAAPLVLVHANAIDSCLRRSFVRALDDWVLVLVLAALTLPLGSLFMIMTLPRALALAGTTIAAAAGLDQVLFAIARVDLPPLLPLAAVPVTLAAVQARRYLFLEKRSMRREEEIRQGQSVQQRFLPEALEGRTLSRYRIDSVIGRGGMGVVYGGEDLRLRRRVAVKVLHGGALATEGIRRRFRREARVLSRLTHPRIARIYDFDSQDGIDFLVIEFVDGETLANRLKRGPLVEAEIVRLGSQILDALQRAHEQGVIHRDLKPSNVMVTALEEATLLDFGIARSLQASDSTLEGLTESSMSIGTPAYMAPEVVRGGEADPRSDVYGAGLLLYEMATGRRPFPDDTPHELLFTIVHQEPLEPRVINRKISAHLEQVILKALQKSLADRYQTADEMLLALTRARGTNGS